MSQNSPQIITENQKVAYNIINSYLAGEITAKDREKRLKKENFTLYSFIRGKGLIKAYISRVNGPKMVLNF